eukprot:gene2168-3084_t
MCTTSRTFLPFLPPICMSYKGTGVPNSGVRPDLMLTEGGAPLGAQRTARTGALTSALEAAGGIGDGSVIDLVDSDEPDLPLSPEESPRKGDGDEASGGQDDSSSSNSLPSVGRNDGDQGKDVDDRGEGSSPPDLPGSGTSSPDEASEASPGAAPL